MGLDITTFGPLPKALREEYPGLVARYYRYNPVTNVVSAGEKFFKEDISICDTSFISMYGFPLVEGNRQKPFADNNSAVITEAMAKKLFGSESATNKLISIQTTVNGEKQHYKVSAVLKDIPFNSVTHLINSTYNVFVPTEGNRYYAGGDPAKSETQEPTEIRLSHRDQKSLNLCPLCFFVSIGASSCITIGPQRSQRSTKKTDMRATKSFATEFMTCFNSVSNFACIPTFCDILIKRIMLPLQLES